MWYIINAANPEQKYVLLADVEYVVGRRDCNILVSGDAAVSRKHAVIQLSHSETCVSHPHKLPLVVLKDVSKFGTWVNKERVQGETTVKDGDEIYFGSPKSTFLLVNEPYIVTTSCLDNASKKTVKTMVRILGGHVVNEWRKDCSLLVMNHISVTIKVICAMVSLKAVVTPKYLEDFVKYLKGEGSEPDAQSYLPPVAESQVNPDRVSFSPDARRTTLFRGMKFIFLSQKQFKKMSLAIELAGGVPVLMEEGSDDNDDEVLTEDGTVVMNCGLEDQHQLSENGKRWVQHVHTYLKKKQKQFIQDSEIGYAVLFASTERHCNPNIDTAQHLMPLPSQSLSERITIQSQIADVLVENTELSQQTKRNQLGDRNTSVNRQESLPVPKIKTEPISQDKIASTGTKRGMNSSVVEESELTRLSGSQTAKQEKEIPHKIGQQKNLHSSKSPSPEPRAGLQRNLRNSKSPSPKPADIGHLRYSKKSSRSPSPKRQKNNTGEISVRQTESMRSYANVGKKDNASPAHNFSKSSKSEVMLECEKVKDGVASSGSSRKRKSLAVFDACSDDDDDVTIRKSTKSATSAVKSGSDGLFDSSDDDDKPSALTKVIAGSAKLEQQRESLGVFDGIDDDVSAAAKSSKKRGRSDPFDDEDLFRGSENKRKRTVCIEDSERTSVTVKQEKEDTLAGTSSHVVLDSEMHDPSQSRPRIKQEIEDKGITERERQVADSIPVLNADIPSGFLTTRKPIKHQVVKSEVYEREPNLPQSVVVTVFVELVKRPAKTKAAVQDKDIPAGYVKWNGKLVKNFKKFKKTNHVGCNRLPNIIGGSDLVVHTGTQHRNLDDWFQEAIMAESQQNEADREALDLFNWEPPITTSRRKASR